MTLLTMVQRACVRLNLPSPNVAYTSTDPQVLQLVELFNEEGQELSDFAWSALRIQTSFTTVAAISQGAVETIAPGYKYIINETMWDRTMTRPVYGSIQPPVWQQMQGQNFAGPWYQYSISGGNINFFPIPSAGDSIYFEYQSNYFVYNSSNVLYADTFGADSDYSALDENLMISGVVWRWKNAKGFEYGEDFNKYQEKLANAQSRDASRGVISTTNLRRGIDPIVILPSGSWNV